MPLLDTQRAQREIGRIRTGRSVQTSSGKQRPEKLDRFLLTSDAQSVIEAAAAIFGGTVQPYVPLGKGPQRGWQVLVDADELPVAVPPGQSVITQWWELWQGGGLTRRCDGIDATTWSKDDGEQHVKCVCPADKQRRADDAARGAACKPTTTLCVMLPDLPGTGQFRLVSHGVYAAMEIGATAELMQAAFDHGVVLPAVLRLSQRDGVRRPGQVTNQFAVPELHLLNSLRDLVAIAAAPEGQRVTLPPPPRAVAALPAGGPAGATAPPVPQQSSPAGAPAPAPTHVEGSPPPDDPPPLSGHGSSGGGMTGQQIADRARSTRARPMVDALRVMADERSLLDEYVDDGTGTLSPLRDVLADRLDQIGGQS